MTAPRPRALCALAAFSVASVCAAGCVDDPGPRVPVNFSLPRGALDEEFLDAPWPSDVMVRADGRLNLRRFPNPFNSDTLEEFLAIFGDAPGYSRNSVLAFRVPGGVDESTLPKDEAASVDDDAGMFLLELASKRRLPITWKHYPEGTSFYPPGTVAVLPLTGVVPAGPYALVVTSAVHAKDGTPLGPSPDLRALLTCGDVDDADAVDVRALDCGPYQGVLKDLPDLDNTPDDLALVQLVTPQETLPRFYAGYAAARAVEPVVVDVAADDDNALYTTYRGHVRLAHFQAGRAPYSTYDGESGGFVYDGPDNVDVDAALVHPLPSVQSTEDVEFVLTVPKTARPERGWPVVINGHGTGGSLNSGLGTTPGNEAHHISVSGAAMLAISEPMHLGREGYREGQENTATFNFFNPLAGRDNWRQSALEKVQLVTMVETLQVENADGGVETFDPDHVGYFGHSQGGIVGGQFVPMESRLRGAFLSGAGAGFATSMVEKVDPPPAIADILRLVLKIPDEEEIDLFHPVPAILQTFVDDADPLNYGAAWRADRERFTQHLVVTSGLLDTFTPKRNHAALAGAFGIPLAAPIAEPVPALDLLGIGTVGEEFSGNIVSVRLAPSTVGMVQFPGDGHFAVFNNLAAQQMFTDFFTTMFSGDEVPDIRTR